MPHPVITALGLEAEASGTYLGHGKWADTSDAGVIEPVNPSNGEILGRVHASSESDYETIVANAQAAFAVWRTIPAPRRGEAIRWLLREGLPDPIPAEPSRAREF